MDRYILVSGVNYHWGTDHMDFKIFCDRRMKYIILLNKAQTELTFQIFDMQRGEVTENHVTYANGTKTETPTKTKPFSAVTSANYDRNAEGHYHLKTGQRGLMSIVDIYAAVVKVGKDAPGTLKELSFFSHAFYDGPILLNSSDDRQETVLETQADGSVQSVTRTITGSRRDPDDFDPRAGLDFTDPTMNTATLDLFAKAFAVGGLVWIWGCNFPRVVNLFLAHVERHSKYKDSGVGDAEAFNFTNLTREEVDLLKNWVKPIPNPNSVDLTFKEIKKLFCDLNTSSYGFQIGKAAKAKTHAALSGTYGDFDDSGSLPLMHVPKEFRRHFTFYKNYLGFDLDPEGRNYGVYVFGASCPP